MSGIEVLRTFAMYTHRTPQLSAASDLYAHTVGLLDGGELDLAGFRGHPTLIVNTASKCHFTPQYQALQSLYERYHDDGLQMLGTPSGDFAGQELDSAEAIGAFCRRRYGVSFPLSARMSVRRDPGPLWRELIAQPRSAPPVWNFCKYLVGPDGRLLARWSSRVAPDDLRITSRIEAVLP